MVSQKGCAASCATTRQPPCRPLYAEVPVEIALGGAVVVAVVAHGVQHEMDRLVALDV